MATIDDQVRQARARQDAAAAHRFGQSAPTRSRNASARLSPGLGVSDDVDRLQARAGRLASSDPRLVDDVLRAATSAPDERQTALERIIDTSSQLQAATFLPRGARAARSVARISVVDDGRQVAIGTGFLVSPTLLMTNHHVLPLALLAKDAVAEFEVELDIDNQPKAAVPFALDPARFFVSDDDLDVTVVAVAPAPDRPGDRYGWSVLRPEEDGVVVGEELNIIGHPSGRLKEIAIRDNRLVAGLPVFLQYTTDTEKGSSGSPVFNNSWEVVALHHASVPRRDEQGRRLRRPQDGQPAVAADDDDPDDLIDWVANEGVRVSAVLGLLTGLDLADGSEKKRLRDELVAAAPPVPAARVPEARVDVGRAAPEALLDLDPARPGPDAALSDALAGLAAALERAQRELGLRAAAAPDEQVLAPP